MSSDEVSELLFGKLPGRKEWMLFYVELTAKHLHIYEGNDSPTVQRRHLRSLEVHGSDSAGEFNKDKRREYKFYYDRPGDGKYVFKCTDLEQRQKWVMSLQRHIQKQDLLQRGLLPDASAQYSVASKPSPIHCEVPQPPPHRSTTLPRHHSAAGSMTPIPPIRKHPPTLDKRDSGFVSGSGDFSRVPPHSNSGDSVIVHPARTPKKQQSLSADGITPHKTALPTSLEDEDLCRFTWYWGMTSRADCEAMLKEKGVVGNFVVRMNDRGDFIMSFWRKDGIHHHKIQKTNDMYRFEKSAVRAEGFNLPDLLDTYMKHCTDRTIGPYGGQLYPNYDEVWSPPDIDFDQFGSKLKNIKQKSNRPIFSGGPGMGGRYGGKTLHEMKVEMEAEDSSSNSSFNETTEDPSRRQAAAPGVPNLAAVMTAGLRPNGVGDRSFKKKKAIPPPPIAMKPRPEKKSVPQPPLTPTKPVRHASVASSSSSSSSRHYANFMMQQHQQQQQQQQQQQEEYNDEDETEEEYVVPSTLLKDQEESDNIYQNYNYSEQTEQTDRGGASYVNLQIGQQQDESLYANITYDGGSKAKPIPPPRDVRRPRGGHRKM